MNETRIGEHRKARGWTQERLSAASGIAVRTIQRLEAGSDASLDTLSRIAAALEVDVDALFAHVDRPEFASAVHGLGERTAEQQARRDAITDASRKAFYGLGVVLSIAVVAMVGARVLPGIAIFLLGIYWAGGRVGYDLLLRTVIDPRLDVRYPLSTASRPARR